MKYLLKTLVLVLVLCTGCDYIKNYDKPHLELEGTGPYKLNISNFDWNYGMTSINKFSGDFERLDNKLYDLLKGKSGECKVFLEEKNTDKYGRKNKSWKYLGVLPVDELNRYQDASYWHKNAGIVRLFRYTYLAADSTAADAIVKVDSMPQRIDTSTRVMIHPAKPTVLPQTYKFSYGDLYPDPEDQNLSEERGDLKGTIKDVNFLNGVMVVNDDSGESIVVQFYPLNTSSYTHNQLRLALKPGRRFDGIVARAGASTVDLYSCLIDNN